MKLLVVSSVCAPKNNAPIMTSIKARVRHVVPEYNWGKIGEQVSTEE